MTTRIRILIPMFLGVAILIIASIWHHSIRMHEQSIFTEAYLKNLRLSIDQIHSFQSSAILNSALDYSTWDEMGEYIKTNDQEWANSNLLAAAQTSGVSFMIIYNLTGQIVHVSSTLPAGSIDSILPEDQLIPLFEERPIVNFFLRYKGMLYQISATTVVPSGDTNHLSQADGFLLVGNIWDSAYIEALELATNSDVSITYPASNEIRMDDSTALTRENDFSVIRLLTDYSGNVVATVTYTSRTQLRNDQRFFYLLTILPAIFALLVILWILYSTGRLVSRPLGIIQQSLLKRDTSLLRKIPPTNIEFREISNLIEQFFQSKHALEKESEFHKRAEEQLKRYSSELEEVNRNKDKFFSVVAHDLRSPFNSLLGFSDLLQNEYSHFSEAERKKYIAIIDTTAKNISNLLENLLQWSRIQTNRFYLHPEVFDLKTEIENTLLLFQSSLRKKDIRISLEMASLISVFADPTSVRSILQNLISNAIKFSFPRHGIEIVTSVSDLEIQIAVRDHGIGMNAEEVENLFKVGAHISKRGTEQEIGSGLGLILSKELIEMNQGKIWVESHPGTGSTFTFSLPIQSKTK